jgi:hypothetical protein
MRKSSGKGSKNSSYKRPLMTWPIMFEAQTLALPSNGMYSRRHCDGMVSPDLGDVLVVSHCMLRILDVDAVETMYCILYSHSGLSSYTIARRLRSLLKGNQRHIVCKLGRDKSYFHETYETARAGPKAIKAREEQTVPCLWVVY